MQLHLIKVVSVTLFTIWDNILGSTLTKMYSGVCDDILSTILAQFIE